MTPSPVPDDFHRNRDESSLPRLHPRRSRRRVPVAFLLVFTTLVGALHAYAGMRLLPPLHPDAVALWSGIAVLVLSTLLIPLGLLSPFLAQYLKPRPASFFAWSGLLAAGFASSLIVLTVLREPVLWLMHFVNDTAFRAGVETYSAAAVIALSIIFTLVGLINARRTPRIVEIDVPLRDLPPALDGFLIAQISDIHVGPTIRHGFLRRIVDKVNTLDAHAIAITGDLVDGSVGQLSSHTAVLGELRARHGAFFVTGNHEYYSGVDAWVREVRRLGITVLHNEHVRLDHDGEVVVLAGVTDYNAHVFGEHHRSDPHAAIRDSGDSAAKILLAHQPRSASVAQAAGFHLQLSGHTHGGQFFPWNLFVPLQQPFTAGLHKLETLWVYTSRGTGYWGPPKRLGAPAEITLLRLVPAKII